MAKLSRRDDAIILAGLLGSRDYRNQENAAKLLTVCKQIQKVIDFVNVRNPTAKLDLSNSYEPINH